MYWKWIIALGIIFELHYAWSLTPGQGYAWFWTPFTCLNILAGLCKFYAWIENQLDSFKYYAPIFRAIWRLVHHITIYGLSAWSASAFTPGFRVVTRRHFSYRKMQKYKSLMRSITGSQITCFWSSTNKQCILSINQYKEWSSDRICKVQLSDENKILMVKSMLGRYRKYKCCVFIDFEYI